MIELIKLDNSLKLDIRYAAENNFVGRVLYPQARAFLQPEPAAAIIRIHNKLKENGLGLVIFDGYRPWSITKLFWEVTNEYEKKFVADPERGSKHNRGCAVDLSIFDLSTGEDLPMPSEFDEFTDRAAAAYSGGSEEETANREMLIGLMEAEGFTVNPNEWWHFDYQGWENFPILDITFDEAAELEK